MITQENTVRDLLGLSPQDRLTALWTLEQQGLYDAERAKDAGSLLQDWPKLRAHILDGGGTADAQRVLRNLLTAVLDDDQRTFWPELIHLLKSAGKQLGVIVVKDGQITLTGVAPSNLPITEPEHAPA